MDLNMNLDFQAKEGTKKFKKLQARMFKPCKYSIEL